MESGPAAGKFRRGPTSPEETGTGGVNEDPVLLDSKGE